MSEQETQEDPILQTGPGGTYRKQYHSSDEGWVDKLWSDSLIVMGIVLVAAAACFLCSMLFVPSN